MARITSARVVALGTGVVAAGVVALAALTGVGNRDKDLPRLQIDSVEQHAGSEQEPVTDGYVVFVDAGHGGRDPGWGSSFQIPGMMTEKDLNLDMARRTAEHLREQGVTVVMSRESDTDVNEPERDINGDGVEDVVDELQARIDLANAHDADVLLSLHFNGMPGTQLGGSSAWYNDAREFSDENRRLAEAIQESQLSVLRTFGYEARDWGALPDDTFETPRQSKLDTGYRYITLIGPEGPFRPRPSKMPGVIAEPLFLTNAAEAALAMDPDVRDALAKGYAQAVLEFLGVHGLDRQPEEHGRKGRGGPAEVLDRIPTTRREIALTFDAGAGPGMTDAILTALSQRDVRASFGLTGAWVRENTALARRIVAEGHMVFNHSATHASWTGRSPGTAALSVAERQRELQGGAEALRTLLGVPASRFFRSPYGDYDASVQRDLGEARYDYNVLWSFDTGAWRGALATDIIRRGVNAASPGAIYVLHVAEEQDALAVGPLIDGLRAAGWGFATLDELLPVGPPQARVPEVSR